MNLLKRTLISISTIKAIIISLYSYIPHLLTLKRENDLLKEEIQYLINSFPNVHHPLTLPHTSLQNIGNNDNTSPTLPASVKVLNENDYNLINKVKNLVLESLTDIDKITIKKISKDVGMSRTKFYELWVSITGETPNFFIHRIRMEKAWELLTSGKYAVNEIPNLIGLKDEKNFRERFKKHFGITPSEAIKRVGKSSI